jgi:hypothetical protein
VWILVFVIAAFIIFFVAYKPLIDKMVQTPAASEELAPLRTDADFIALSILAYPASAGTASGAPTQFSDSVVDVFDELARLREPTTSFVSAANTNQPNPDNVLPTQAPRIPREFAEYVEGSSYAATLDGIFGPDSNFWKPIEEDTNSKHVLVGLAVVLVENDERLEDTCREYGPQGTFVMSRTCLLSQDRSWVEESHADFAVMHIPSTSGTHTVHVYLHWRGR